MPRPPGHVKVLLLAGELETRPSRLTNAVPKCLVPIAERPLLDLWVDCLAEAGIAEARINTHVLAELVRAHIEQVNAEGRLRLVESYRAETCWARPARSPPMPIWPMMPTKL